MFKISIIKMHQFVANPDFGSSRRAEYTIGFWLGTYEKYRTLRMTTQVGFRSTLISHPVSRKHVMF